jgi:ribosomal protein L37AE/L43A
MVSDDWFEKPPPESVYANTVECHWCGHKLVQHSKDGDRPCKACGKCVRYMGRSLVVRVPEDRTRGLRLVSRLLSEEQHKWTFMYRAAAGNKVWYCSKCREGSHAENPPPEGCEGDPNDKLPPPPEDER